MSCTTIVLGCNGPLMNVRLGYQQAVLCHRAYSEIARVASSRTVESSRTVGHNLQCTQLSSSVPCQRQFLKSNSHSLRRVLRFWFCCHCCVMKDCWKEFVSYFTVVVRKGSSYCTRTVPWWWLGTAVGIMQDFGTFVQAYSLL